MVSLSLLKLLEQAGFGTIDKTLFWEKLSLGKDGLYVSDIGGNQDRGTRHTLSYQIYSRAKNDVKAYQQLQAVADFLAESSFVTCTLPAVPPVTTYGYGNVTLLPPSSITNVGEDINGRIIYSITGQLYYGSKVYPPIPPATGDYVATEGGSRAITENNNLIITENNNG